VLDETFGIMVYQEDVSKVAVAMAGFSHADADGLRKIMSKKDKVRRLRDYRQHFCEGARLRGVTGKQIDAAWNMMMSFDGYSFCKPHSASYARVSFQTAYLKTHYPAEFMAAVISNQGGFYSTFAYVSEVRRMGIKVLPPDVNKSDIRWKGKKTSMRVGLLSIKHLAAGTQARIVEKRREKPYRDISDFCEQVRPDDREARVLIHAGAFDSLHRKEDRAGLLWELAVWQKLGAKRNRASDLFSCLTDSGIVKPSFPPQKERERLRQEFAALGFLCDRHPMVLYAGDLEHRGIIKAKDMPYFAGRHIRIAGILITGKVVHTKHGDPMEFLTFEDETGLVETTFFPKAYRRFCTLLGKDRPFILYGKVEEDFGAHTMTVERVDTFANTKN